MNSLRQFFNDYFPFLLLALIVVIGAKYRTLNRKSEEVKYNIPERMDNVIIDKSVINGNDLDVKKEEDLQSYKTYQEAENEKERARRQRWREKGL